MPENGSEDVGADAFSADPVRFKAFLQQSGQDYLLLAHSDDRAELRFTGPFEGREVVWHCEFVTLYRELKRLAADDPSRPCRLRNFIEIGAPVTQGFPVRVGLAVPRIDLPAIAKMVRMLRQYRNLRRGRHEYGEPVGPASP